MISNTKIKTDTPVFCSNNVKLALVDHMEGTDCIKLKKDRAGQHHFIPLSWVTSVDDKVHLDRTGDEAKKGWSTSPTPEAIKTGIDKTTEDRATNEGMKSAQLVAEKMSSTEKRIEN